jgi:signal transduction histidine kinase
VKTPTLDLLPPLLTAVGLFGAVAVFVLETLSFRDAVSSWARRDLEARAELASSTLKEAVETGDFKSIHAFGAACSAEGVWLTVLSAPGGVVFDSRGRDGNSEDSIFAVRPCGEFRVRLGLPVSRVMAPYRRARIGFLLAGIVGGTGVLFVILFYFHQRAKMRELARERDAQFRLVEELKKVEAFRRDFIADVSHEIKTPLTGIIGAVDILSSPGELPPESGRRLLSLLKSESERLNNLVQSILSLAKMERGAADENRSFLPNDISDIAKEVAERYSVRAAAKGVTVKVDAPVPCAAPCDEQLVSAAISNLVANAITHSGAAEVSVSVSRKGDMVSVEVEDHGIGVPIEERERIFDRFHRVDRSRSSDTGGSGLGLSIVREVARLHGGNVYCEAVCPSGCRFVFTVDARARASTDSGNDRQ